MNPEAALKLARASYKVEYQGEPLAGIGPQCKEIYQLRHAPPYEDGSGCEAWYFVEDGSKSKMQSLRRHLVRHMADWLMRLK